jgi:predicted MFS family arabinose efflux permease
VPPTTAIIAERFGRAQVGLVYGWVFFAHQVGAASAAWLGGLARDSYGNYTAAFLVAGVIAIAAAVLSRQMQVRPGAEVPAGA